MNEEVMKALLEMQKNNLEQDVQYFKEDITDVIASTPDHDEFGSLYVSGNFFKLATETTPQLKEEWEQYNRDYPDFWTERQGLLSQDAAVVQEVLDEYGIKVDLKTEESWDKKWSTTTGSVYVDDKLVWRSNDHHFSLRTVNECLGRVISSYDHMANSDYNMRYSSLNRELSELESKKSIFNLRQRRALKKEIGDAQGSSEYMQLSPYIGKLREAYKEIEKKSLQGTIKSKDDEFDERRKSLKDALRNRATTVLALRYLSVYNDNFDYLRMMPEGAKPALQKLLTEGAEYYAKNSIENIANHIDEWIKVGKIASALHEQWRDTRKDKDGNYEPRWREVTDPFMIKSVKGMKKLPDTIRIEGGVVEQDIANTEFGDLCLNYQLENFEAAQVAFEISKEDYSRDQAGIVGKKIHDEWLRRNPWSKGSELDVEFKDLIYSEKIKDLIHYETAKEIRQSEDSKELI